VAGIDTVMTVLTQDNIVIETNIEYENASDVQFTVVKEPVYGVIEVIEDDGQPRSLGRRFSLADVLHGLVIYRRNVSVQDGVDSDQIVIVVRLDDLQTTGTIHVDLTPRPPLSTHPPPATLDILGSMKATVDELGDIVLTSDQLNIAVTSYPVPINASDIRYEVSVEPRHGMLLSVSGALVRMFTQSDVNAGLVQYRHRDASGSGDSFRFRVRHLNGNSELIGDELEFVIDVIASVMSLSANNLTTIEGQSAFIDDSTLILGDHYHDSADVIFTVVTQPSHGRIEATAEPGVRLTQFSGDQLAASTLRYVHNDDEAGFDNFAVSARLRTRPDRRSSPTTIHVDVIGVNDQQPTIVVNARMRVWTGMKAALMCITMIHKNVKVKKLRRIELLMNLHLRATGCHLPHGITHCYPCHPTQVNTPRLNALS